jgi:hypothetical protein
VWVTAADNFMVQGVTWQNGAYSALADSVGNDNFGAVVNLEMGKNKIIFTAVDAEGNSRSRKLTVIRK